MNEKPGFYPEMVCPNCGSAAVGMLLKSANHERVVWCDQGHVVISMMGMRGRTVFDFRKHEWDS